MKLTRKILTLLVFFLLSSASAFSGITNYRPIFVPFYEENPLKGFNHLKIAIRSFERDTKKELLILDPDSFETGIVQADAVNLNNPYGIGLKHLLATPFYNALEKYTAGPVKLQNHGIVKGEGRGLFITVDLCPSNRPFDKKLFETLASMPGLEARPAPVAVAISGDWLRNHPKEFKWLLEMIKANKLDVTWINHSYSHPYEKGAPLKRNFLLKKGVNFYNEALKNEALMIESGILPSPFFRFPGLVAGAEVMEKLKALSLIPIGANAWLAKGESPAQGSIILVHGNGNEPNGIKKLLKFLNAKKAAFKNHEATLGSLKDAFAANKGAKENNMLK